MARTNGRAPTIIAGPFAIKVKVGRRTITLRLTPDAEDGGYVVTSPTLRGLNSQGDTVDDAVANGCEAARALFVRQRVLRGLADVSAGRTRSQGEVERRMRKRICE